MGVLKVQKAKNFTVLDNGFLQRSDLSAEAKGTLAYLVSLPADWHIRPSVVAAVMGYGKDKQQRVFSELHQFRYLIKVTRRAQGGHILGCDFVACDIPLPVGFEETGDFNEKGVWVSRESRKLDLPAAGEPAPTKDLRTTLTKQTEDLKANVDSPGGEYDAPPRIVESGVVNLQMRGAPSRKPKLDIDDILRKGLENKPKPKPKPDEPDYTPFFDAWNELAPNLPKVTERGRRGLKQVKTKLKGLIREFGFDEALDIFEDACKEVNQDTFWQEKRLGIDNLARHAVAKSEKWGSRRDKPSAGDLPEGMDPNSREATEWLIQHGDLDGKWGR